MGLTILFDDSRRVPDDILSMTGVGSFGGLIHGRRTLLRHVQEAAQEAGLPPPVVATTRAALDEAAERAGTAPASTQFLLFPANLAAAGARGQLTQLLRTLAQATGNQAWPVRTAAEWTGLVLVEQRLAEGALSALAQGRLREFVARRRKDFTAPDLADTGLIDLRDPAQFVGFLANNFDARHFNSISDGPDYTLVKRSRDRAKLRREFEYYGLLPAQQRIFFVQPFDFQDDGETASYRMERLLIADMGIQWVHGTMTPAEFGLFLDRVFSYVTQRPARRVGRPEGRAVMDRLYRDKVVERVALLKSLPAYGDLAPLLARAVGGIDALTDRYLAAYQGLRDRFPADRLVVGHGDLCFSNILYSKATQLLRFIDPRGVESADELHTDPYYDLAKLSHSILGGYDFVNSGQYEVALGADLGLTLASNAGERAWAQALFRDRLAQAGFDPLLVRLCEASLFISMAPLHIDVPKKILGFALTARSILEEIEQATAA
ncbi:hypothetical protein [Nitrospirillum viridazoti]|uniref:Phosphotransferase family enzyme n=1 Tax=Nitrospirillum amazonense TaxID=28077 RepID=A0A560I497_9PROT|nr:hypothetical protein [Nitrospirillum amazonense]TWB52789.1 hypothetical protein FBZ92_11734 [Nitrospirillum amazonense]